LSSVSAIMNGVGDVKLFLDMVVSQSDYLGVNISLQAY
jgi:hypothetical protein